ncbi:MAG: GNAT family N-acetyltransferase, partial [Pantoea sp.]|nr:GNAT family N-acetyltransferase [Pantoea sp.]
MSHTTNEYGQPVGQPLTDWQPRPLPQRETLEGRYCRLEPLSVAQHGDALRHAYAL